MFGAHSVESTSGRVALVPTSDFSSTCSRFLSTCGVDAGCSGMRMTVLALTALLLAACAGASSQAVGSSEATCSEPRQIYSSERMKAQRTRDAWISDEFETAVYRMSTVVEQNPSCFDAKTKLDAAEAARELEDPPGWGEDSIWDR